MNTFANTLFSVLLGWVRTLVLGVWSLFTNASGHGFFSWLGDHWLALVLVLVVAGSVMDYLVWLIRWRPYYVWRARLARLFGRKRRYQPIEQDPRFESGYAEPVPYAGGDAPYMPPPVAPDAPYYASEQPPVAPDAPYYASEQPSAAPDAPYYASEQPPVAPDAPYYAYEQPPVAPDAPYDTYEQPPVASAAPYYASDQPPVAPDAPYYNNEQPFVAPAAPYDTYEQPPAAPDAPYYAYEQPPVAPAAPYDTYEQPPAAPDAPYYAYEQPPVAPDAPYYASDQPPVGPVAAYDNDGQPPAPAKRAHRRPQKRKRLRAVLSQVREALRDEDEETLPLSNPPPPIDKRAAFHAPVYPQAQPYLSEQSAPRVMPVYDHTDWEQKS